MARYAPTFTVAADVCRLCPQESISFEWITGFPSHLTVELPPVVRALQCALQPSEPQHGCGVTGILGNITGLPSHFTVEAPIFAAPPAELISPALTTFGM